MDFKFGKMNIKYDKKQQHQHSIHHRPATVYRADTITTC